jgi:hypothetical protein
VGTNFKNSSYLIPAHPCLQLFVFVNFKFANFYRLAVHVDTKLERPSWKDQVGKTKLERPSWKDQVGKTKSKDKVERPKLETKLERPSWKDQVGKTKVRDQVERPSWKSQGYLVQRIYDALPKRVVKQSLDL